MSNYSRWLLKCYLSNQFEIIPNKKGINRRIDKVLYKCCWRFFLHCCSTKEVTVNEDIKTSAVFEGQDEAEQHFTLSCCGRQRRFHNLIISNSCHVLGGCFEYGTKAGFVAIARVLPVLSQCHHLFDRVCLQVNKTNQILWSDMQPLHGHSSVSRPIEVKGILVLGYSLVHIIILVVLISCGIPIILQSACCIKVYWYLDVI